MRLYTLKYYLFFLAFITYSMICVADPFTGLLSNNNESLIWAGRTAQEAFKDNGVVELLRAANKHNSLEAKRLVDSGVNVNKMGKDGATPLIWMLGLKNLTAMKMLLDLGANPDQYQPDGIGPPVWLSAGGGNKEALQLLLEYGGNPNQAYGTKSPLMMAISNSQFDCAELLLNYGANINYSGKGLSAIDVAWKFEDMLWVLNHGYTHDLPMARKKLAAETPRAGEGHLKVQTLEIIDRLLSEKSKQ